MTRGGSYLTGEVRVNHAVRIATYRCFSAATDPKRSCRRGRLKASYVRGERMSGSVTERRTELRGAWWPAQSGAEKMRRFLEHRRLTFQHHLLQCGRLILKGWCSPLY